MFGLGEKPDMTDTQEQYGTLGPAKKTMRVSQHVDALKIVDIVTLPACAFMKCA